MKSTPFSKAALVAASFVSFSCNAIGKTDAGGTSFADPQERHYNERKQTKIQVALLLDTSNSMDGLIEQAKSRLWNIINTLTTLRYHGVSPQIEIALYEYGNDGLSSRNNYIRQVIPMTTDLDLLSEKLFALRTNGGEEYCGAVIQEAVNKLDWGLVSADMKLIYIAGNEPFNQGRFSYKEAVAGAVSKDIYVNTIFCGQYEEGVTSHWKDGAGRGRGKYFNIDADRKVRFIETPYDAKIEACNKRLNDTYIGYGSQGVSKKQSQIRQDANAKSLSSANYAERSVSKSKAIYKNESWDLVDKSVVDKSAYKTIDKTKLEKPYQQMADDELKALIEKKSAEREVIQKEILALSKQRQAYIDSKMSSEKTEDDLGVAINNSILDLAAQKGYVVTR